jgi:hypothetical protein
MHKRKTYSAKDKDCYHDYLFYPMLMTRLGSKGSIHPHFKALVEVRQQRWTYENCSLLRVKISTRNKPSIKWL